MARKILLSLVVGVFCAALSGLASAEAPVWNLTDDASLRDPVETGAMPEMQSGSSVESRSHDNMGPTVEFGGVTYHYNIDTP